MGWNELLNNQMVSFTDAQTGGFILKAGQSNENSSQCMTKVQALAKYDLIAASMSAYQDNQLAPKITWVPTITPRTTTKSRNVLIVYDLNSVIPNGYFSDVNPANIATTISNRETALGFTPSTITSYSAFEALSDSQIANYAHIWDVGYDTLITPSVAIRYKTYLSTGGAMFLLGENGGFIARDNSLASFVTEAGGGTVSVSAPTTNSISTIAPEFRLVNSNATIQFLVAGKFSSIGSGTILANNLDINAAVWKTGLLSSYPTAAIASVLDVNFLVGSDPQNQQFIENLSIILNYT